MAATTDDPAVAAAPLPVAHYHTPRPFAPNSPQLGETQSPATSAPAPSSGGSSDAAQALRFQASCQPADAVGNAVRMNGSESAVVTVTNAQAYPTVGIIIAKASATTCTVQTYGLATGAVSGLTALQRYFVGPNGTLATSGQVYSAGQFVQLVGFAVTSNTLFVQPSGTIGQLAASRDGSGADATPEPSSDGEGLLYGGVLYGTDAPADDLGRKGDSYFCYQSDGGVLLYGPKTDSGWGQPRNLKGESGNRIYIRDTAPTGSETPNTGDLWLDTTAYNLYPAE